MSVRDAVNTIKLGVTGVYMVKRQTYRYQDQKYKDIPWCSAVLTAINVVIFLICEFTGDWLYDEGQFSVLYLTHSREYYRLVTSMFLHADIGHLVNNMILLYFGGEIVEKTIGSFRYLALFFISGICGNLLSAVYELTTLLLWGERGCFRIDRRTALPGHYKEGTGGSDFHSENASYDYIFSLFRFPQCYGE